MEAQQKEPESDIIGFKANVKAEIDVLRSEG